MRLIDADALKEAFRKRESYHSLKLPYDVIINNAPTVDTYTEDDIKEAIKAGYEAGYEMAKVKFERPQGEPVIKCKDCKYQVKEWREDRRMKEKGYWTYGCKHFGELMGYWGFGGNDNEFCSSAEVKEAENE